MALIVRTTAGASTPGFVQPGSTRGCLSSGALFVVRAGRGEVGDRCGQVLVRCRSCSCRAALGNLRNATRRGTLVLTTKMLATAGDVELLQG